MPAVVWDEFLVFSISPLELFIRGTCIYLLIFVVMRAFRREPGTVGIADLLMLVLIADASQNAMSANYKTVLDGFVLILTIFFWNYALDWITLRFPRIERFTYPAPIALVKNGQAVHDNMRRQFVTHEQLMSVLREHGIEDVSKVKAAYLEGSGHTSVVPFEREEGERTDNPNQHRRIA